LAQTPKWRELCITPHALDLALGYGTFMRKITKEIAMSVTAERILIVILLIVAVIFATRDAHAGIFVKCHSYTGSQCDLT